MEETKEGLYLGLDLNDKYTMLSVYQLNMTEPVTMSTVMGSEEFQIPTFLGKKKGIRQWFFGNEARRRVQAGEAEGVEHLLKKALAGEVLFLEHEQYKARELLLIFLKQVLQMANRGGSGHRLARIAVCMENIHLDAVELLTALMAQMGISAEQLMLLDRQESFYYFVLNQKPEIFLHDVALFDYTGSDMTSCILQRNMKTIPQVITMEQGNQGKLLENKDRQMEEIVARALEGHIVSAAYLVGDGFDGDWMKASLQLLCQNRKVFQGKNLYSKGACYAGVVKGQQKDWPFVYIGSNELKLNLYIKVLNRNELQIYTLITAGESWYESKGECEVILDGDQEIAFWVQHPESRQAHVEVLELTDLPERKRRTTRLRITAIPVSDWEIHVIIKDLGFGELVPSSNKVWEHYISLPQEK